jgi:hypothetical protein
LADIFKTMPLGLQDWLIVIPLALLPLVVVEIYKVFVRARKQQ